MTTQQDLIAKAASILGKEPVAIKKVNLCPGDSDTVAATVIMKRGRGNRPLINISTEDWNK